MYAPVLCGKLHVYVDFQMADICEKGGFEALRFIFSESRAWMCHLSVPWQPPKKCLATQKRLTPCWFLCETVGFEVLLLIFHIFRSGKEGKNPTIQKVVIAAVFIFLGQDVPRCAILVFW